MSSLFLDSEEKKARKNLWQTLTSTTLQLIMCYVVL